ncbi:MAG: Hsp20 family protein [Acidobacteriia bacterium]|nr:Hsp20 family protein [Terriglobia bacterium]
MKPQSLLHELPRDVAIKPKSPVNFWDDVNDIFKAIEKRAYEFFEQRGRENGRDLEDWFKAENELFKPTAVEISDKDNSVVVRAQVPGFTAEELEIDLEPSQLIIRGKQEKETEDTVDTTVYSESRSKEIFREVPLPFNVVAEEGVATLTEGVLEITAPKVPEAKTIEPAVADKVA